MNKRPSSKFDRHFGRCLGFQVKTERKRNGTEASWSELLNAGSQRLVLVHPDQQGSDYVKQTEIPMRL